VARFEETESRYRGADLQAWSRQFSEAEFAARMSKILFAGTFTGTPAAFADSPMR
jgi:hypothetical protein